jgi:peptidoglycan/LPS O-acetylase OafA/YrhL
MTILGRLSTPQGPPRFDRVDVLRGLSILAVVLLHTWLRFYLEGFDLKPSLPDWLFHILFRQGGNGVTIFFAISGFLITSTSIERFGSLANLNPAAFYRIRFARIGPPLLLILAILSVLDFAHVDGFVINPARSTLVRALFAALTFHLNWLEARVGYLPANWDVLWSLSIEEMFYLFFPLGCFVLLRFRRGLAILLAVLGVFVILGPFARTILTSTDIAREKSYLGGMDAIALGCMTALLATHLKRRSPPRAMLLILQSLGTLLVAWMVWWPRWSWIRPLMHSITVADLDDLILPLGACLIMLGSTLRAKKGSLAAAPIRWFGRHSYEVYLTHEFVVVWGVQLYVAVAKSHRPAPLGLWVAAILILTAPLGWLMARFFSEPLNRALRPKPLL